MSGKNLIHQRDDLFTRIERYYKDEGKLSEADQAVCERWILAFTLLQQHRSKKVAIKKYMQILEYRKTPVAINTAYQDFQRAELIFVPINKVSKEMQRLVLMESIDNDIEEIKRHQKHLDRNQHKIRQEYQDQINKLYDLRIKAGGLQHDDPNIPDFSNLQMPNLQINISPKLEQVLKALTVRGSIDTTELMNNLTQDAETIEPEENEDPD